MKKDFIGQLPSARKNKLIIKELADETLVYDLENDQAHCLNSTAARVWQQCDGQSSVTEIAQSLAGQTETKADDAIVWLALDQLRKFNLLEAAPATPAHLAGMSRRQWVRNVGFAAIALPVIMSIAAPSAQAQGSCPAPGGCATPGCIPTGCPCSPNGANVLCAGGNCVGGTGLCN